MRGMGELRTSFKAGKGLCEVVDQCMSIVSNFYLLCGFYNHGTIYVLFVGLDFFVYIYTFYKLLK